jgi:protease-4
MGVKQWLIYGSIALTALIVGVWSAQFHGISRVFASCSIQRVNLYGDLTTYPERSVDGSANSVSADEIVQQLTTARYDPSIAGVVLDIDSPGGSMVAGEEIASALQALGKPSVALIRDEGASAAYRAALGANAIVASSNSNVGSIGVIYSYLEDSIKNAKDGITNVEVSSGKYKSLGDPNAPLTPDQRALVQRDVDIMSNHFIKAVSDSRHLDLAVVKQLADGSTLLGVAAKDAGLVDMVGNMDDAVGYISSTTGRDEQLCQ